MEHESARAEPDQVSVRHAESRLPLPAGPARLLRLQREAGNRAVGGLLRRDSARRLARADAATDVAPAFTIPPANEALDVVSVGPTEYRAELHNYQDAYVAYDKNCADAAMQTLRKLTNKALYMVKDKQPGLRTYDRTNPRVGGSGAIDEDQTDLNWNTTKLAETLAYIKGAIDRALPVYIGINEGGHGQQISGRTGRPINEGITDHFLIIVGYTAENRVGMYPFIRGGWRVTKLQAIDNASSRPELKFPTFDVSDYSVRKPATGLHRGWAADAEYQITQVRVYSDDVESLKSTSAWWD